MAEQYLTQEKLDEANSKDVVVDAENGLKVRIRALDPMELVTLLPSDTDVNADDAEDAVRSKLAKRPLTENMKMIDGIVIAGLVNPRVSEDGNNGTVTLRSLGGYKLAILNAILEFSGARGEAESFRKPSAVAGGGVDG